MTVSFLDWLRAVTAPPKRSLMDFRRNLAPGDSATWNGGTYLVSDVAATLYSGKQVLLHDRNGDRWVALAEVYPA